jgi:hypothetical protein
MKEGTKERRKTGRKKGIQEASNVGRKEEREEGGTALIADMFNHHVRVFDVAHLISTTNGLYLLRTNV